MDAISVWRGDPDIKSGSPSSVLAYPADVMPAGRERAELASNENIGDRLGKVDPVSLANFQCDQALAHWY
jgi:hypothetical protein